MRSWFVAVGTVAALLVACGGETPEQIGSTQSALGSGQYLLMVKNVAKVTALVQGMGGAVVYANPDGFLFANGLSDADAAALAQDKNVQSIEPDESFQLDDVLSSNIEAAQIQSPGDPTTAARYAWQWNMRAIDADKAWARGRLGSSNVTVAILDTGIDYEYPDLWGRVDLSRSISFVPSDNPYINYYFPGRHPVTDLYFHGTHVAATVASNAYIAAGVTSKTTLIGVKVCGVNGSCGLGAVISGVYYAVDQGAQVINMSLGGGFAKAGLGMYVGFINKVFNYANLKGVTVVVAAGNESADLDHNQNTYATYCDTPNTLCVSATGPTSSDDFYYGPWYNIDAPAVYTNYGVSSIWVAAPGGNSGGYVWAACSTSSLVIPACQTGYYIIGATGTSMASPHVAGLAALVVEDVGAKPGIVRTKIMIGADDLGPKGADPFYGVGGRINVNATAK